MYAIIGMVTGLILDYLIIKPIQRKWIREKCVKDGLVPRNLLYDLNRSLNMEEKNCYYECLVGVEPDKEECQKNHPGGCETCDWYLVDPSPENCPVLNDDDMF